MKRLLTTLAISVGLLSAGEPVAYLVTYGAWPLCVNGVAGSMGIDCSWYTVGSETYMLGIRASNPAAAVAYKYVITGILTNGKAVRVTGMVERDDDKFGNTTVVPISFGGTMMFKTMVVEVAEMTMVSMRRVTDMPEPRVGGGNRR